VDFWQALQIRFFCGQTSFCCLLFPLPDVPGDSRNQRSPGFRGAAVPSPCLPNPERIAIGKNCKNIFSASEKLCSNTCACIAQGGCKQHQQKCSASDCFFGGPPPQVTLGLQDSAVSRISGGRDFQPRPAERGGNGFCPELQKQLCYVRKVVFRHLRLHYPWEPQAANKNMFCVR
jgi:hypothetical protein